MGYFKYFVFYFYTLFLHGCVFLRAKTTCLVLKRLLWEDLAWLYTQEFNNINKIQLKNFSFCLLFFAQQTFGSICFSACDQKARGCSFCVTFSTREKVTRLKILLPLPILKGVSQGN
jgi:hypothetical protein